jgi:thymidylate synthase (FAD)
MRIPILDHGYVELIEAWGSDERIVEAARMSTGKGFLGWGGHCPDTPHDAECRCKGTGQLAGDEKLLKYLMDNRHHTPFEMAGIIIEVQAPIMVFREWHRHRTQSYNEMSARYTPLPDVNYIPTPERCLMVSAANKQAGAVKGSDELTHESVLEWLEELSQVYVHAETVYQSGLKRGIPKELARLPVPVGRYSRMRASTCLRNWLAFITLRSEHVPSGMNAQFEIRQSANAVGGIIAEKFPRTWELFKGANA